MRIPTIRFTFARKGLSPKDGKGTVEMVITVDRQRKYISTGVSCLPHQWKGENKRNIYILGTGADMELNQILLTMYQKAYRIVSGQVESGRVDISAIPTLLKAQSVDITFLEYVMKRMEKKNVVEYTQKSYISFYNKLVEYGRIKFFSDISEKTIRDFDEWLHAYTWTETDKYENEIKRTYSQATIGSYHKNLKNFIADAVIDGYLTENVYVSKGIKVDKGKPRIENFLTIEELKKIENAGMPTKSLSEARDLFVFQSKTGMSYVDLMNFDYSIVTEEGGVLVYRGKRHKTQISFLTIIPKSALFILEKYNYRLPKLPNQKYNIKLKLVADAAGIDKEISSHWARRSAAMIWLNEGVPVDIVSRIIGHTNLRQTAEYAHILDKTVIDEIKKLVD